MTACVRRGFHAIEINAIGQDVKCEQHQKQYRDLFHAKKSINQIKTVVNEVVEPPRVNVFEPVRL